MTTLIERASRRALAELAAELSPAFLWLKLKIHGLFFR
jgi:hypothetical protein